MVWTFAGGVAFMIRGRTFVNTARSARRLFSPRPGQADAVIAADVPRNLGFELAGLAVEDLHAVVRGDDDLRPAVAVHIVDHERRGVVATERAGGPDQLAPVSAFVEGEAVALA